ncbi:MAG: nicotinate-nucleotide--dimethylbenzimidazole phosphoribosyltransferase [Egibacteraceae bacterium]
MSIEAAVAELAGAVSPVDEAVVEEALRRHDQLAKPPGSLGALERLGAQLCGIAGRCPPPVPREPAVVVAAGDHGVHAQGVTPWPQEVTAAMVELFCQGGAAVNAIAGAVGARVAVLDVGVASPVARHPRLRRARVRDGTADLSQGPAMTREEAARAVLAGAGLAEELVGSGQGSGDVSGGVDLLVAGDMGIANTAAAACLVAVFTGADAVAVTGPGAGADAAMLARKRQVVAGALALHRPDPADPLGVLAAVGGLEHAALVGVILSGAADRVPVVLDGVSANAAALVAVALQPAALGYLIAGHRSTEPAATAALAHLGLVPLLDLSMRLGEGTGGLLAVPLVTAAAAVLTQTATIADLPT